MINVYEREGVICMEGVLTDSGRTVFSFLVDGMLIDTGAEKLQKDMSAFCDSHSFDFVALTHSHEDHTGNAAWIEEHVSVPLFVHPSSIGFCAKPGIYPAYRQQTWGQRCAFTTQPLGESIRSRTLEWQVIHTPGHAEDHMAFYHAETGRLFSGDLFVSAKTKVSMDTESIPLIMKSLRTLLALDITALFCSHAGYFKNGREQLERKLAYLEELSDKVTALSKQGYSAVEIKHQLFPAAYPIIAFSNGEWDSLHVVNSILADLPINHL
ncbi:MBL fold metallo-hydrolase [Planococcus sp. N028]|uniref:MBL fold metallo-hydrolase n=1 Tax=Planococcus shixiaomingii TaxID=3058393 RepID=A0ABT8MYU0_9BACL|nr:MBL fold metallo-hydrolase [Planococcus sp. N028]MDN7240789.1 MBL fold metallo-hydrolase [Planococcus sp. N028]